MGYFKLHQDQDEKARLVKEDAFPEEEFLGRKVKWFDSLLIPWYLLWGLIRLLLLGRREHERAVELNSYDEEDTTKCLAPYGEKSNTSMTGECKLKKLRERMRERNIGVYIVGSADEHQSETPALSERRREFICEFTGSAGTCVITLEDKQELAGRAALSTDSRYFTQAEKQLDCRLWRLLREGVTEDPSWRQFAVEAAASNSFSKVVSCDPKLLDLATFEFFDSAYKRGQGFEFAPVIEANLVDEVWGKQKPIRSRDPIYALPLEFSGEHPNQKLSRLREYMKFEKASHLVVSALDEIAWLYNLRADCDIPYTPVFYSYSIVTSEKAILYVDEGKLVDGSGELRTYLSSILSLVVRPYRSFYEDLSKLHGHSEYPFVILPYKSQMNAAVYLTVLQVVSNNFLKYDSFISYMKLAKNLVELKNARAAQDKGSLAYIIFAAWLEESLLVRKKKITEYDAACKIYRIREKFPNFKGLSYQTISSSGANAAIVHYSPTKTVHSVIDPSKIYLIDSGSQFLEGTTDITRTFKFGYKNLRPEHRKYYTLVLKGHIGVATARFDSQSSKIGSTLDSRARNPLLEHSLNYGHGTGHGIGSFGLVHEGPLYIKASSAGLGSRNNFRKGAIITDEPGYYVNGKYGFRIESELEITSENETMKKDSNDVMCFNYLTKVPLCRKLIDKLYLDRSEVEWVNSFHQRIRKDFSDVLLSMGEVKAYKWLLDETLPI